MPWRETHLPDLHWAPRGLSGSLRSLPGWGARAAAESRFAMECAQFAGRTARGLGGLAAGLPEGQHRTVLVIPGFGFGDASSLPLQLALRSAGYTVLVSGIHLNIDCSDATVDRLVRLAQDAVDRDGGRPLLVVGHSRGGMLARGLAVRRPDLVACAVSLGAPLNYEFAFYEIPAPLVAGLTRYQNLDFERRMLACSTPACTCDYLRRAHAPLPSAVRLVSLYTASDGVVDWRACVVPGATNIEVQGSHLGMGLRPATIRVVLEQLAAAARVSAASGAPAA
jgi:pimeloyl-ACP methyl ester carboxylesterase